MNKVLKGVGIATALTLGLTQGVAAKEKIVIGELNFDGGRAIQSVLQVVMEKHLGVDTETVATDQGIMFKAMDKGKGAIDVLPDLWMPAHADKWDKFIATGSRETVAVNKQPYQGAEGIYIPGYIQDKYGVKSVQDLSKPEIVKLFDSDGDGKGEYWPGAPGWGSTNVMQVKIKSYGLDSLYDPLQVSDSILKAKLKTAYRKKEGVMFYYWAPEWIHDVYDLRKLEEPAFDGYAMDTMKDTPKYKADGCWNMYQPQENEEWLEKSRITCAFEPSQVYVAFSRNLYQRSPRVAKFLEQVTFDRATINSWIVKIAIDKADPMDVAREWIEAHPESVASWLEGV